MTSLRCVCDFTREKISRGKMLVAHSQHALSQRQRHMAGLRWPHLWCDAGTKCREHGRTRPWQHAQCHIILVLHNLPLTHICVTHSEVHFLHFSCKEEAEKKCEKLKHFATHFGSRYFAVYPLKFDKKQVEVGNFFSLISHTVVLCC